MSYLKRVEQRREADRETNLRHLARRRRASESGRKTSVLNPEPIRTDEKSALRKLWDSMTRHLSRKTLKAREEKSKAK